ncbi:MAG: hypothetical protein IIC73_02155 [Armatimonadetes bacterium]|nr:hypothetical protein [Armatimonadota bacterium]
MGFNPRLAPYSLTQVFAADPAADEIFTIFRFPVAGKVLDSYATNTAAIATATNTLALYATKYSAAATPVLQGTLGSWAAGSTWAVDVPRRWTQTSLGSTALFAAGEWVRLSYDETTTGTWTELGFQIDYVLGYDTGETASAGTGPS